MVQGSIVCRKGIFRAILWISLPAFGQAQEAVQDTAATPVESAFEVVWGASDSTRMNAVDSEVELYGSALLHWMISALKRIALSIRRRRIACAYGGGFGRGVDRAAGADARRADV